MTAALVWLISAGAIACMLIRPKPWPEAIWACGGAALLVLAGLLPWRAAVRAVGRGADVYLFLTGMMLLTELARREGVFDWLAALAVRAAHGSPPRLFALIYGVGILVTVFLSNDATAIVLTPAVYAAVRKARVAAMPYLLACAFVANAASFVLPISNPANLVVYGAAIPPLGRWLALFLVPAVFSILATFGLLWSISRQEFEGAMNCRGEVQPLARVGVGALWGIGLTGAVLISASALGASLGWPTLAAALVAVVLVLRGRWRDMAGVARHVSWSVLPLVAGLFAIVEALNEAGAASLIRTGLRACAAWNPAGGAVAASAGAALFSNLMNNLPSGLLASGALRAASLPARIQSAVLIGVDLGPNLSVTGSLATILWLIALRREGEHVSGWTFLKAGILVMPPALLLAAAALAL